MQYPQVYVFILIISHNLHYFKKQDKYFINVIEISFKVWYTHKK